MGGDEASGSNRRDWIACVRSHVVELEIYRIY